MFKTFHRGLLLAGGLTAFSAGPAFAGTIEKPPGVPPEVEEARQACPTVVGPCYGYHPTRWRALPCCTPDMQLPRAVDPALRGVRDRGAADVTRSAKAPVTKPVAVPGPAYPTVGRVPASSPPPTEVRPTKAWVSGEDR